jgi:hypothetical protein
MADDPCEAAFGSAGPTGPRKYYRARYYDPKLGRFISEDPLGFDGGINLHAAMLADPVNLVDPYGLRDGRTGWRPPFGPFPPNKPKGIAGDSRDEVGNFFWAAWWPIPPSNKCNLFVAYVLERNGVPLPVFYPGRPGSTGWPPRANDWANPNVQISCCPVVDEPQVGDVIAQSNPAGSGHVGFVSGMGKTISATPWWGAIENDWGFRPAQRGRMTYRRCGCQQP